ncbi:MAG: D-hexose-6-phosphate mutarotase [Planctomycetes bacterium]|nr:D-hexose-6-phosphate mutarotase [Planctomycetota bacterium]
MSANIDELNRKFAIPGVAVFRPGSGNLPCLVVENALCHGTIYLHGAHVTAWQKAGGKSVLWMGGKNVYQAGRPFRGGVPICLPWFGRHPADADAPIHGIVRLDEWQVQSVRVGQDGQVAATLAYRQDDKYRNWYKDDFEAAFTATFGSTLTMTLEVKNPGAAPIKISEALHTYFAVSDITKIRIGGLEQAEYYDYTKDRRRARQDGRPISFSGFVDRLYFNTQAACTLDDNEWGRRIVVAKQGSDSTIVWNPFEKRAQELGEFMPGEWRGMVCIETGNAADNILTIQPGRTHVMQAEVSVQKF